MPRRGKLQPLIATAALAALSLFPRYTWGALISFDTRIRGEQRVATVELKRHQDLDYVSLPALTSQLGGGYDIWPTRMKIDIGGATAWVQVNDNRVKAVRVFSLKHPAVRDGQDVLIAVADVELFFSGAFGLVVKPQSRPAPPAQRNAAAASRFELQPAIVSGLRAPVPFRVGRPTPHGGRDYKVVIIDPGHGRYDVGIQGRSGLQEKDLVLQVALKVEEFLAEEIPQQVILTRREDTELSLKQRALIASNGLGDLLISIHAGGAFSSAANGVAIFHPPANSGPNSARDGAAPYRIEESRQLARAVAGALTSATTAALRGIVAAPCRLLSRAAIPGILVEVGCLTNPSEEALLETESYQEKIARGIARGLADYINRRHLPVTSIPGQARLP